MMNGLKKLLAACAFVFVFLFAAAGMTAPNTVSAATAYVPRLTAPSTTNKYYIHTSNGGYNSCIEIDKSTGSCLPNCVGYAWGRAYEILGKKPKLSLGNADKWWSYNKNGGYYKYGSTPKLGAVMCWGGQHVAVVEKIEGNYITISESSYGGARFNTVRRTISAMESRTSDFQGYIYIGDFGSVTATPMTLRYYPNKGTGTMADVKTTYGSTFTVAQCGFERVGYSFGGWAGYRPSDSTYFVKGVGWCTQEVINSKGYTKRVYMPGESFKLDTSWTKDPLEQNVIGFAAFWNPCSFNVTFNDNGVAGSAMVCSVKLSETFTIPEVSGNVNPGHEFLYWNVYRSSDDSYYVAGKGWFTEEEIQANGYTKRPYYPGEEYYIDISSWLSSDAANNDAEFVFEAAWEKIEEEEEPFFADVNETSWYYSAVRYVYEHGLMSGLTTTEFAPKGVLSREQFATIIHRLHGAPEPVGNTLTFTDVSPNSWYTKAVLWANENGIITGYNETTFGKGDAITREQMAAIMYRYGKFMSYDVSARKDLSGFTDASKVSSYAREPMQWAAAEGIISGNADGTLNPKGSANRVECAAIIMRFDIRYSGSVLSTK